jgi:hypothetical protein
MAAKHETKITTPVGPRTWYGAIVERTGRTPLFARFGGILLTRQKTAVIDDRTPGGLPHPRKELVTRLKYGLTRTQEQRRQRTTTPYFQPGTGLPPGVSGTHGTTTAKDPRGLRRLP